MGNPPFVGKKEQSKLQKDDIFYIFGDKIKGVGNLDYVCAWYKLASRYLNDTRTKAAFVSTNSITQGEQVPVLWGVLLKEKIHINFAYRTFIWDNESSLKAHVHCVIIGFSKCNDISRKMIYDKDHMIKAEIINPYLINGPCCLVERRKKALCCVPEMLYGSMPIDDGHLILDKNDLDKLLSENGNYIKFVRKYAGGAEIIKNEERWCLWLKKFSPKELNESNFIKDRLNKTSEYRNSSDRPQTITLAKTPYLFGEIRQPECEMLVLPKVSSENRNYVPICYVSPEIIVNGSALIIPNAPLYLFGILISSVHMAWMRAVCGRMKSDYQYSKDVVYNNFPWPDASDDAKAKIEQTAQAILDARALYPDSSLADLYDETTMPDELRKAHRANDLAVMKLYGYKSDMKEPDIVADLFRRYEKLVKEADERAACEEAEAKAAKEAEKAAIKAQKEAEKAEAKAAKEAAKAAKKAAKEAEKNKKSASEPSQKTAAEIVPGPLTAQILAELHACAEQGLANDAARTTCVERIRALQQALTAPANELVGDLAQAVSAGFVPWVQSVLAKLDGLV